MYVPHTMFFFTFWKGKCIKTRIMTNVGKNRLVKVIFTNIHKISDACANSFGRYLMIAQCMRNVFTLYSILWGNGVSEKIKAHLPQHPASLQQLFSPHLINFIQKIVMPTSPPSPAALLFKKEGRDFAFYMRHYEGETTKFVLFYMTDFLFTEMKKHNI